jgi:putative transcriptional regulator
MKGDDMRSALLLVLTFCLGGVSFVRAADLDRPLVLVAKPELQGAYHCTVLVVTPLGADQHAGFIVNRPTEVRLGSMFPDHGPSQKVLEPVYLGGPLQTHALFALVQRSESPGGNSLELMPGLFAAVDAPVVDRIIEAEAARARFVAGLVAWRAGELREEIKRGAWYVLEADAALLLRDPDGLWEELVQRSIRRGGTI